jgi:hypothetical protein
VPHAPRLVGFVPSAHAIRPNAPQYAFENTEFNSAVVTPASFHTSASVAQDLPRSLSAAVVHPAQTRRASTHSAIQHSAIAQAKQPAVVTPKLATAKVAAPAPIEVLAVASDGNQNPVPTVALYVLRTAERVGPDSYVWSIHVWQVTFVPDAKTKIPPAKKT